MEEQIHEPAVSVVGELPGSPTKSGILWPLFVLVDSRNRRR
jgi:hypothetical protein